MHRFRPTAPDAARNPAHRKSRAIVTGRRAAAPNLPAPRMRGTAHAPMPEPLRIGIAGLGTVGCGVLALLRDNAALLEQRTGRRIEVAAVSARDRGKERGIALDGLDWRDERAGSRRRPPPSTSWSS